MKAIALACLAVTAVGCAPKAAPPPPPPDENAIRTAINGEMAKFTPALSNKDAAAVANLFTENATWVLPDASTFTGRANIETGAKKFFGSFESFKIDQEAIDKLIVVNDSEAVAFARGDYTLVEKKGGKPQKRVNPFADYWKKGADGTWRLAYEINADGPVPGSTPSKP